MTDCAMAAVPGLDLSHIESWVFDLDNTLYPASSNLFGAIDTRMRDFIADALAVDPAEAWRLQKAYFHDYGTTLRGLMLHHRIAPEAFLEYVHAIDMSPLTPSPALAAALARLEGRKIVFTNGSARHAENVMDRLGISRQFSGIFDIAAAEYRAKPDPEAYRALVRRHRLAPKATALFEDLTRNLAPAAALGMTTIWVRNDTVWAESAPTDDAGTGFIHHVTDDLIAWLGAVARPHDPAK